MALVPEAERTRGFRNDAFFTALDAVRQQRKKSWRAVAKEAEVNASTLTRMSQGRRPDVDSFAALVTWADLDADQYLTAPTADDAPAGDSLEKIAVLLRHDPNLTEEASAALDQLLQVTYDRLKRA